jgi:hypothetical protein
VKGDRATARPFSKIISMENYPKNYCLFREVASARIKQAPLTVASRRDGWRNEQQGALEVNDADGTRQQHQQDRGTVSVASSQVPRNCAHGLRWNGEGPPAGHGATLGPSS